MILVVVVLIPACFLGLWALLFAIDAARISGYCATVKAGDPAEETRQRALGKLELSATPLYEKQGQGRFFVYSALSFGREECLVESEGSRVTSARFSEQD